MMYGYGGWGVWSWAVMGVMMLLFWGSVALLVFVLLRRTRAGWDGWGGHYPPDPGHDDPERILSQRFARGEIDETEYRARLEALRHRP